ncbi:MAG: transcription-repair coupling factor [Rhodobacteraceae bacterium]|nr:transcription-repair coupling factor [Paracoccaceae bacterium]
MISKIIENLVFEKTKELNVSGVPEGYDGFLLGTLFNDSFDNILHIARDDKRASLLRAALNFFYPDIEISYFPAWDCLPFDRSGPQLSIQAERLATLSSLSNIRNKKRLIITTINAITQKVLPLKHVQELYYELKIGKQVDISKLKVFLNFSGYLETAKVMEVGEFSIRGGIIDIFAPLALFPVRFDFFGDLLENARFFSIADQKSIEPIKDNIILTPVREVCLATENISLFKKNYLKNFGAPDKSDYLYSSVLSGQIFPGYEQWLPFFYEEMNTLFDYIPNPIISFDSNYQLLFNERKKQVLDYYEMRKSNSSRDNKFNSVFNPIDPLNHYIDEKIWKRITKDFRKIYFTQFETPEFDSDLNFGGHIGKSFSIERQTEGIDLFQRLANYLSEQKEQGRLVSIAAYSMGSLERLKKLLNDQGLVELAIFDSCIWDRLTNQHKFLSKSKRSDKQIGIGILPIENGFTTPGLTVISEQDILGKRLFRQKKYERKVKNPLQDFSEIGVGDLVVHVDHGVGKYVGFKTIMAAGAPHDCLIIQYLGEDRLFLPVENMNLLSKYGQEVGDLDRLGSLGWQDRRSRAKKRINELAESLIEIAAKRKMNKGAIHLPDSSIWEKFCSRFQFEETEDQNLAIREVLSDFSSGFPMDRLICGDVGFGKTEVALRAALVVALDGFQVAVLAPTTLLARQHYQTFVERFKDLPIHIERLTRFEKAKEKLSVIDKVKSGVADIVIGTHALLSDAIRFKKLGLLVVDEEQHFGVSHKEVLKKFRSSVHVLTLTATPIPRTLQLSLTGVRDLSIIATPPVDRLVVRTFVMEFDSLVIRESLLREKNRGGQSFFVVPRVSDIPFVKDFLQDQVPEVSVKVAHGKLSGTKLDEVLNDFLSRKIDLLLSTSIVESGLDFPNANTLIVYRSNMFGLSQLYQIRGRVGRSKTRAYCYLTYDREKQMTPQGEKRLKILASINSLGQGFSLASQDLDIRGAGNLLGDQQSGDIREVGYELYQSMLKDAIKKLNTDGLASDSEKQSLTPQIDLNVPVLIPESYVTDLNLRLTLYRELSLMGSDSELGDFCERLRDRFGPIPDEINTLVDVMTIKNFCLRAGIEVLRVGSLGLSLSFHNNHFANPDSLMTFIESNKSRIKVKENMIIISATWDDNESKMNKVKKIVKSLARMAEKKTPSKEGASY